MESKKENLASPSSNKETETYQKDPTVPDGPACNIDGTLT
jgi:hypothetical protein